MNISPEAMWAQSMVAPDRKLYNDAAQLGLVWFFSIIYTPYKGPISQNRKFAYLTGHWREVTLYFIFDKYQRNKPISKDL